MGLLRRGDRGSSIRRLRDAYLNRYDNDGSTGRDPHDHRIEPIDYNDFALCLCLWGVARRGRKMLRTMPTGKLLGSKQLIDMLPEARRHHGR
jgi:hypothetical protein